MAERLEVYKCSLCGNIVEVLHGEGGTLACCGEDMDLLKENTTDAAKEKHVPVIESGAGGVKVKVGSVPHPMEDAHFIEFVEVIQGDKLCRVWLKPGASPEAEFSIEGAGLSAREFCNLHGLWKA
jgi:superoxide reductase